MAGVIAERGSVTWGVIWNVCVCVRACVRELMEVPGSWAKRGIIAII